MPAISIRVPSTLLWATVALGGQDPGVPGSGLGPYPHREVAPIHQATIAPAQARLAGKTARKLLLLGARPTFAFWVWDAQGLSLLS